MPNVRRVRNCPLPATHSTTRRSRHRLPRIEYILYVCGRHAGPLTSSSNFGGRHLLEPAEDERRCGTLLDHRPAERIVADHIRLWLGSGVPMVDGRKVPWRDWAHALRGHYEDRYLDGGGCPEIAEYVDLALSAAERARVGEHTEEQLAAVLDALATAEHLSVRGRPDRRCVPPRP